ncbi:Uncharacterized protein Rs2_04918 [Raphanus sativus]|nr:Uncharacterized protein Rs2_04918 [Raphanus sativus]
MSDQIRASSQRCRSWGLAEIGNPYGELTRFCPELHSSLSKSVSALAVICTPKASQPSEELVTAITVKTLKPGWGYTVLHVQPFNPRVVREFISNILFDDEGPLIRGIVYRFEPSVINRLMMTPSVEDSFKWEVVVLNQAIAHLTRGQCYDWKKFSLTLLVRPFQTLYRVCELNCFPCPASESMIQNRLRLLYAITTGKRIDYGRLVYDQVIELARGADWQTDTIFPNLIYQFLMMQREIPSLPGDERLIGGALPIYAKDVASSLPSG